MLGFAFGDTSKNEKPKWGTSDALPSVIYIYKQAGYVNPLYILIIGMSLWKPNFVIFVCMISNY